MQIQTSSHVKSMQDPDGAVLLDIAGGKYFSLNGVAAAIWSRIQAGDDDEAILDHLEATFGVDRPRLRQDLDTFLDQLQRRGLIHVR